MNFNALVQEAMVEVKQKRQEVIEKETAYKWAARAIACLQHGLKAMEEGNDSSIPLWRRRYYDYEHEALEHAAMVRDDGRTLADIEGAFDQANADGAAEIGG